MPKRVSTSGSELFIVDNSDTDWKVLRYLHDWCQLAKGIDIATGYFEIGGLLALRDEWQNVDQIRILMGDECSMRTKRAFDEGLARITAALDDSIERAKEKNDFLTGVPAIVDGIRSGRIQCRVYRKDKFHAKAYITHARLDVVGSAALVGSSNFTEPGITENIELNVQITGAPVSVLQEWYEEHWNQAEDVTPQILRVIERHVREYTPFEVYAKALQEFFRGHEMTVNEWEKGTGPRRSRIYPILDQYQKDGYHQLQKIAAEYKGAFLCDGVGLGTLDHQFDAADEAVKALTFALCIDLALHLGIIAGSERLAGCSGGLFLIAGGEAVEDLVATVWPDYQEAAAELSEDCSVAGTRLGSGGRATTSRRCSGWRPSARRLAPGARAGGQGTGGADPHYRGGPVPVHPACARARGAGRDPGVDAGHRRAGRRAAAGGRRAG